MSERYSTVGEAQGSGHTFNMYTIILLEQSIVIFGLLLPHSTPTYHKCNSRFVQYIQIF